jgi:hypothetical protein
VTAYEKCLQHAIFLVVDLVRTIEAVIASQPFHRHRGREHAVRLARCLEARGDVDGVAPDVVANRRVPIIPAITVPECRPTRIGNGAGSRDRNRPVAATMSRANFAAIRA